MRSVRGNSKPHLSGIILKGKIKTKKRLWKRFRESYSMVRLFDEIKVIEVDQKLNLRTFHKFAATHSL